MKAPLLVVTTYSVASRDGLSIIPIGIPQEFVIGPYACNRTPFRYNSVPLCKTL